MMIIWEKVFKTANPDFWVLSGGTCELCFWFWQNEVATFKIKCSCGKASSLVPILCEKVGFFQIFGRCVDSVCTNALNAEVVFVKG